MVPINKALKTTYKNQVFRYGGRKIRAFVPHPTVFYIFTIKSKNATKIKKNGHIQQNFYYQSPT